MQLSLATGEGVAAAEGLCLCAIYDVTALRVSPFGSETDLPAAIPSWISQVASHPPALPRAALTAPLAMKTREYQGKEYLTAKAGFSIDEASRWSQDSWKEGRGSGLWVGCHGRTC